MNLTTLRSAVTDALGTSVSTYFTDDKKTTAINWAIKYINLKYEVPEFVRETVLTFTSGKVAVPATYLRHLKLYETSDATHLYTKVDINKFDDNVDDTWTKKDDGGTQKFWVYPSSVTSLTMRYVKYPTELSADTDETEFNEEWKEAIATFACYKLLFDRRDYNDSQAKMTEAREYIKVLLQHQFQENEFSKNVTSLYENYSLLDY